MKILQELGLTEREAEIYELLLRTGESPVSVVIALTKAHPQVVYRTIDALVAKGLVLKIQRKHKYVVSAENPKQLEKLEEEKLSRLRRALPDLMELQKSPKDAIVRIARGEEAVRALRFRGIEELPEGGTYYVIGASGDRYYKVMGERHQEWESKRIKKKIKRKLVSFIAEKGKMEKAESLPKKFAEFRFLSDEYPIESSTNIFNNTVAIIIWSSDPIVITMESEEVAESYKKYFYALWHVARQ